MIDIERTSLPSEAKEGDILNIIGNSITIDTATTERKRKYIEEITKGLLN